MKNKDNFFITSFTQLRLVTSLSGCFCLVLQEYCAVDSNRLNTIRTQLRNLKVIFIDEISMVGSGMFNVLNLRLQQIMGTKEPFGGVSLITVGDLFQLKPVFDKWIFENSKSGYSALASNIWTQDFTLFELTDIMRQKDDRQFAELLNRLREGNHTDADLDDLKERKINVKPGEESYPMNMTYLLERKGWRSGKISAFQH